MQLRFFTDAIWSEFLSKKITDVSKNFNLVYSIIHTEDYLIAWLFKWTL